MSNKDVTQAQLAAPTLESVTPQRIRTSAVSAWCPLLTLMAFVVFLKWAQAVFIPVVLAILFSYALTPAVNWLEHRIKLPKALGAALTLFAVLGLIGMGLTSLEQQAINIIDIVPHATEKLRTVLQLNPRESRGTAAKIEMAANEIEKAANSASVSGSSTSMQKATEAPRFRIREYLLGGTIGLAFGVGQFVVIISLIYFLLIAGDTFRRTLIRITDNTLSDKKITLQMLDEINTQIQRYLLLQLVTSALVGVVAWIILSWVGLQNAGMWGAIGGLTHLIPYAGPAGFVAIVALIAYVQFDTLQPVATIVISMVACNSLIGLLILPWLTQKVGSLNAVTVFIALLAWGWLWGVWGLLLGIPIMMAIKAVCDRVEDFHSISAFIGHAPSRLDTST